MGLTRTSRRLLDQALVDARAEEEDARVQLVAAAQGLRADLGKLLDAANADQPGPSLVNPLGEVQALGSKVDRLCALYTDRRRRRCELSDLASRLVKEEG